MLILDEPMADLGPGGTVELAKLIKKHQGPVTILLVEHDMDVVFSLSDRVTVPGLRGKHRRRHAR